MFHIFYIMAAICNQSLAERVCDIIGTTWFSMVVDEHAMTLDVTRGGKSYPFMRPINLVLAELDDDSLMKMIVQRWDGPEVYLCVTATIFLLCFGCS